jgi:hypothetical protein
LVRATDAPFGSTTSPKEVALVLVRYEAGGALQGHPHRHGGEEHEGESHEGDVTGEPADGRHEATAGALQRAVEPTQGCPPAALVLRIGVAMLEDQPT